MNRRRDIRRRQLGISLVEILVVLMIAALVAGVVVMSAPPIRDGAQDESERFAARLSMAAEQAVTKGEMIGLKVVEDGYRFYRYRQGEWRAMDASFEDHGAFPAEVGVEFKVSDDAKKNLQSETKRDTEDRPLPEIFFSPTGETTPFEIAFQERRARVSVTLDGAGGVEVKTDAETQ
jgi:type II secretion system protein H